MGTMRDALLKAGLKETATPKKENERAPIPKKQKTETHAHQQQRNFCEHCQQVRPDVELYHHRNPTTQAEWICVKCADQLKILDTFRKTAQSDTSIRKMFRREYGATASSEELRRNEAMKDKNKPVNGNR